MTRADKTTQNPSWRAANETTYVRSGVRRTETGAVATGIEVATTFAMEEPGRPGEFDYARAQNPTRQALEEALAAVEGAAGAAAFASGLAAIDACLRLVPAGSSVMIGRDAYGGTWRLLDRVWDRHGITAIVADTTSADAVAAAWRPDTAMVIIETPSNPLLQISDIAAVSAVVHRLGGRIIVDSTFATPWLQQPLALGADLVLHSTTKGIGGHSDVVGGAVMSNDPELLEHLRFIQKAVGAVPGPFDSFLVLRGLRTLPLRVERACENAAALAAFLEEHPAVARVHFPGLSSHPGHDVAARQMRAFGTMISIEMAGGESVARSVAMATRVFTLAESLGAVESLIEHPASMTHAGNAGSELEVPASLLRLSVGIENLNDLCADLIAALPG